MTKKRSGLVSAALALVGAGVVLRIDSLVILSIPLAVYVVLAGSVFENPHLAVSVSRETDAGKIFEGGVVELGINIKNEGGTLGLVKVEDTLPKDLRVASGSNLCFDSLAKGDRLAMRYKISSNAPGFYTLGPIVLTTADFFGLRSKVSVVDGPFELDVLPRVERLRTVPFKPWKTQNWPGQVVSSRAGPGQEFYAVRQYASGDPTKVVNWKAWARLDKMYSNEYMSELGADAVIVVDKSSVSDFGVPPESALTYVERCSAALSSHLLSAGNRIGMLVVADRVRVVNPGSGRKQLERILLTLVRAGKGPAESLGLLPEYLSIWFPRERSVIVVSSLADVGILDPLNRLGARRNVHVITPSFTGMELLRRPISEIEEVAFRLVQLRRRATVERLRRHVQVVEWKIDSPADAVMQRMFHSRGRMSTK
jgi:uncharacterized protein (DUF58 family)